MKESAMQTAVPWAAFAGVELLRPGSRVPPALAAGSCALILVTPNRGHP